MKSFWLAAMLALPMLALAADEPKKDPPKPTRLGVCSKEARTKGLKGEVRKKYLSACIAAAKPGKTAGRAAASPAASPATSPAASP